MDAGVHFGHQVRRFNPKSKKFVFANRSGISVIDLEKTYNRLEVATEFVEGLVSSGKTVLFVGTKKPAKDIVKEAAVSVNMPYATSRWLGGTLTNFVTVRNSIEKYKRYLTWQSDGTLDSMHNKESSAIRREMVRMNRNFEGIVGLESMPGAIFIVDARTEEIAVAEATRLKIPVIALVDTNSDPSNIQYPVPGNDDALKSIRIIVETMTEAVQSGLSQRKDKDPIQQRTVKPVIASPSVESEVPATAVKSGEEDTVPETFSSDD